jgi:hypothetical protein
MKIINNEERRKWQKSNQPKKMENENSISNNLMKRKRNENEINEIEENGVSINYEMSAARK